MTPALVLPRRTRPTESDYRDAVHDIICEVGQGLTDRELGDRIGISEKTVRNARNKLVSLSPLTLAQIGHEFGAEALQPYVELCDGIIVGQHHDEDAELDDILETGSDTTAKIFHFRRRGINHTHERPIREALKKLQSKITGYLARRSERRIARRMAA